MGPHDRELDLRLRSATDSPSGPYGNFTNNWFRAPGPISFAGGLGCNVEYAMKLNTESGFDFFFVDASTNGSSWTEIAAWTGTTTNYPNSWFSFEEDLSAYDGQANVHIRMGLFSDESITAQGAHIDGVNVRCVGMNYTASSYQAIQGTSMATPHVAGVAALAWAKNPAVSVAAVKNALLNGGDAIPPSAGRRSPAGGSTRTARWR